MHIHPNNNLSLATLGAGREDVQEIQAKRAAEIRRKLSAASRVLDAVGDDSSGPATRVKARSYGGYNQPTDEEAFGRLFSAKA